MPLTAAPATAPVARHHALIARGAALGSIVSALGAGVLGRKIGRVLF